MYPLFPANLQNTQNNLRVAFFSSRNNTDMHPKPVGWTILYVMCAFFFLVKLQTSDITKTNLT